MIDEKPTMGDDSTRIWQVEFNQFKHPACLASWLVYAPWMHPAWSWHTIGLVHLRDIGALNNAIIQFPGATHEFVVVALNPEHEPTLDSETWHPLIPVSIAEQFIAPNDAEALGKVEALLKSVAARQLSVDSDFRGVWRRLLNSKQRRNHR